MSPSPLKEKPFCSVRFMKLPVVKTQKARKSERAPILAWRAPNAPSIF